MTIEIFKNILSGIIDNFTGIRIVFITTAGEEIDLKISKIDRNALERIAEGFKDKLKEDILENEDLTIPLLSNFDDRKNALFRFDYEQTPFEFEVIKESTLLPPNSQNYYNPLNKFIDVKGIIILISGNDKCIALYKNKTNLAVLQNTKKLFNLIPDADGYLKELPNEVLKLDFNYDIIYLNNEFFIKNQKTLELKMKFHQIIETQAILAINALKESLLIDDISNLERSSRELSFARKLAKVSKHSPVLGQIDAQSIIDYVSQHKFLSTVLQINESGDKLVIKTKISQKHFIKLMSDDYLQSDLTKIMYDSLAKDKINT